MSELAVDVDLLELVNQHDGRIAMERDVARLKAPGVLVVSVLVRADFPVTGNQADET